MASSAATVVERAEVFVRYVEVGDEIDQIRGAWPVLEAAVGSLRGRRFVAVFDSVQGWYRACAA